MPVHVHYIGNYFNLLKPLIKILIFLVLFMLFMPCYPTCNLNLDLPLPQLKSVTEIRPVCPADALSVLLDLFAVYEPRLFRLLKTVSFENIK
jgi:hypothetical protein